MSQEEMDVGALDAMVGARSGLRNTMVRSAGPLGRIVMWAVYEPDAGSR